MKKKSSIFLKIFLEILGVTVLSNAILAALLYVSYEKVIDQVKPFIAPQMFSEIETNIFTAWIVAGASFILIFIIVVLVSVILVSHLIPPIRNLLGAIHKIEQGDLSVQVREITPDEIGELSKAFNHMVRKLKKQKRDSKKQTRYWRYE